MLLQVHTAGNEQCCWRSDIRPSPITHSQEASIGTCTICWRENINTTGLLWNHGPRENPCSGSHTHPQVGSIHISTRVKTRLPICTVTNGTAATVDVDSRVTPASPWQMASTNGDISRPPEHSADPSPRYLDHPKQSGVVIKRIPKGARPEIASLLQKLICTTVSDVNNVQNWEKLLGFSSACLVRPGRSGRGGKSRNLTTSIIKQTRAYKSGVSTPDDIIDHHRRVVQPHPNE